MDGSRNKVDDHYMTRDQQLSAMMEAAAKKAVEHAFEQIGLGDDEARRDLSEIRSLIDAYRTVKRSIFATLGQLITMAILGALGSYYWLKH